MFTPSASSRSPRLRRAAFVAVSLVLGLSLAGAAVAQPKLAVIDVEKILTDSKRGKAVLVGIKGFQKTKADDLRGMQDALQALNQKFADGRLSLAEDVLAGMQKELEDKTIAMRRAQDDAQRELQEMQQKEFAKIEEDILPIIQAVGAEEGYTMIFNKFQSGLVYADESVDITALVVERFDAASS